MDSGPFTKRLVVVPSKAMKNWLSLRLAEDLGIAAGVEFVFLEPALRQLQKSLTDDEEDQFQFPSRMELALSIEREIRRCLQKESGEVWKPLKDHLVDRKSKTLTKKGDRRLVYLADQLAGLFSQYEKYGREMLLRWIKEEPASWQEVIWKRVIGKTGSEHLLWRKGNTTVHVFALSYVSRQQHRLFCDLSNQIPVDYYLLSPCEVFWSDLLSDKENARLIRCWEQQGMSPEALAEATELLFERNPLLANWGRLGRLMAAQIEESTLQTDEHYVVPLHESTCLQALQTDLLKLRNGKHHEPRDFRNDNSIQIHVSTSKTREVQALYQTLLGIIHRHRGDDEKIDPYDIVVMAPNIKAYEPMIRAVFQSTQSQLDCQIMDLNLLDHNDVINGFFHLLEIPESRWENETVLNLFSFPSFQERHGLTQGQVEKIGTWVRETGIKWGIDSRHRSELLLRSHCEKGMLDKSIAGTWKIGIDRLLLGTAMILPQGIEEKARFIRRPFKEVSATDQELLGEWAHLIRSLKEDLSPLESNSRMSLGDWSDYLIKLLNLHFSWQRASEDEKAQVSALIKSIELLKTNSSGQREKYPFSTVIFHVKKALELQEVHYRESHFQAVRFCSMLPMRAVPAKVVVMMGVSEENYPRKEEKMVLNQLYSQRGVDPFPTATEFDRYLFLEAVLSARKYLILSYHKKEQGAEKLHQCSLLISELVHYLDQSYTVDGGKPSDSIVFDHPFYPFDKRYFQPEEKVRSYSMYDFHAAESFYKTQMKEIYRFIPSCRQERHPCETLQIVDVKDVKKLARNPFRFYFQKQLGMYLKEEEEVNSEEILTLSPLELSKFRKESWCLSIETMLQIAEKEGVLPVGPFRELSIGKVKQEAEEICSRMEEFSIKPQDIFELHLCETCDEPKHENHRWTVPPLTVKIEGGSVKIQGTLQECSPEGMIAYKKGENRELAEIWPMFLIWCRIIEENNLPFKKDLILMRSGEKRSAFLENSSTELSKYLEYYRTSINSVSPLIPEWVDIFIDKSSSDLEKSLEGSLEGGRFYNDEVKWVCRETQALLIEELFDSWSDTAKQLYSEPIKQWSGKKK